MKKEEFIALGISEELAVKAEKASLKELEGYMEKATYQEVMSENKTLKQSLSERDTQLENLKKSSGDNTTLQQQISELQNQNIEQQKVHEKELAQLKLDHAIEVALSAAKAKNAKAVKAMMDLSKVKLGEDGKLSGFEEQMEALKKSDGYMFDQQEQIQQQFIGYQPAASSGVGNAAMAGYEARLLDARKNNNQLEVIKIKQEAADNGIVLM